MTVPPEIDAAEQQLRAAMLADDVPALERLLADDLVFIDQGGGIVDKQMDLDAHRTGAIRIAEIEFSERRVLDAGEAWIVVVRAKLSGAFQGAPFAGSFRYCRVWRRHGDAWQVASGSVTAETQPPS